MVAEKLLKSGVEFGKPRERAPLHQAARIDLCKSLFQFRQRARLLRQLEQFPVDDTRLRFAVGHQTVEQTIGVVRAEHHRQQSVEEPIERCVSD